MSNVSVLWRWWTDHRGGKKLCDVSIQNERELNHWDQLSAYVFGNGFETVTEWVNEIKQLNEHVKRWRLKKHLGWVYLVSRRG